MSESHAVVLDWHGVAGSRPGKWKMRYTDKDDEQLMLLCREGNTAALEELFRRYKEKIYHFAYRMLGDAMRAEDVLQETFLRIHANADTWKPSAKFTSWAYKIARNLCVDEKRKYWNRRVYSESQMGEDDNGEGGNGRDALSVIATAEGNPRDTADDRKADAAVRQAIDKLSPEQREVMILSKYEGLSYPEIADVLGTTQESVKQRAYRAHMRLRTLLKPLLEEFAIR